MKGVEILVTLGSEEFLFVLIACIPLRHKYVFVIRLPRLSAAYTLALGDNICLNPKIACSVTSQMLCDVISITDELEDAEYIVEELRNKLGK